MKKTKRYDDGGLSSAQKEWLGGADQSDPIIMARMRAAVPDTPKDTYENNAPYKSGDQGLGPNTNVSEVSTPKAVERTVVKTKVTPRITGDDTINPDVKMRSAVSEAKKSIGVDSLPKSFKEAGGNTTATKSKADMPSMKISIPDPLSKFNAKGQRTGGKDFELGVKKGGAIKKMASGGRTSASKRADGIATKGFTRG